MQLNIPTHIVRIKESNINNCRTCLVGSRHNNYADARLAQSVERETLNLKVVGSTPTLDGSLFADF